MRRRLVVAICFSIFLTHFTASSSAATKAGSTCSKLNSNTVSAGIRYTCIKSGTKLVWNKGVKVSTQKPSVAPTASATRSASPTARANPTTPATQSATPAAKANPTTSATQSATQTTKRLPQIIRLPNFEKVEVGTETKLAITTQSNSGYTLESQSSTICSILGNYVVSFKAIGKCTLRVSVAENTQYLANSVILVVDVVAKPAAPTSPLADAVAKAVADATAKAAAGAAATPTPTRIATPTPTPTRIATPTPTPSVTPTSSATPTPSPTPTAGQSPFVISNSVLSFIVGSAVTLTTSGGAGNGAVIFSVMGPSCSVSGNTLASNGVTTCVVTAVKAASSGVNSTTSPSVSFQFTAQPFLLTYSGISAIAGGSIGISYSGGSPAGIVTFSVTGDKSCKLSTAYYYKKSLESNLLATCVVTASQAASPGYEAVISEPVSFAFGVVDQSPLVVTSTSTTIIKVGDSIKLAASGGSGTGFITYSVSGTDCAIVTTPVTYGGQITNTFTVKASSPSTCSVTATKSASPGFNARSSIPVSYIFGLFNQLSFSISGLQTSFEGNIVSITPTGGSGTGLVTYSATGSYCSISGNNLTSTAPTTCTVIATKAASVGYNAITSQPISVVFQKVPVVDQQPLTISKWASRYRAGEDYSSYAVGGSGNGIVTYKVTGENCTSSTNGYWIRVSATNSATCEIIAFKAASIGFNSAESPPEYVSFRVDNQAPIYIIKDTIEKSFGMYSGGGNWLGITGGTGSGKVSYSVTGANCSLSGSYLTATAETTCTVTATKAAIVGYNEVSSAPTSFIFKTQNQIGFTVSGDVYTQKIPLQIIVSTRINVGGTGAITGVVTGQNCFYETVNSSPWIIRLWATAATTCQVTATKAASLGLYATTSPPVNFIFTLP